MTEVASHISGNLIDVKWYYRNLFFLGGKVKPHTRQKKIVCRTWVFVNGGMDKEEVVHSHNGL